MKKPHIRIYCYPPSAKQPFYVSYVGTKPFINTQGYEQGWGSTFENALADFFYQNQKQAPPAPPASASTAGPAAAAATPYPTMLPGPTLITDEPAPYHVQTPRNI